MEKNIYCKDVSKLKQKIYYKDFRKMEQHYIVRNVSELELAKSSVAWVRFYSTVHARLCAACPAPQPTRLPVS